MKKVFVLIILLAALVYLLRSSNSKQDGFDPEYEEPMAYIMSQDFIKAQLKAPATADFPSSSEATIIYNGDSTYTISSYVDAQNSFGALIRTKYAGKIKYLGNDRWRNIDLILADY